MLMKVSVFVKCWKTEAKQMRSDQASLNVDFKKNVIELRMLKNNMMRWLQRSLSWKLN